MDSLALPSVASNTVSLREELDALPTEVLKRQLANTLGLTARHLMRLAVIVAVLEDRGENLSALKSGFLGVLRRIAAGELLPDLVVLFASEPDKIRRAANLPLEDQREIAEGRKAIPDRRPHRKTSDGTRSYGPAVGRIHEPTAGCNAPNPIREIGAAGNPKDVADAAAEMVLACADREAAVGFLLVALEQAGVEVSKPEPALPPKARDKPPGYWLDRTKFDAPDDE